MSPRGPGPGPVALPPRRPAAGGSAPPEQRWGGIAAASWLPWDRCIKVIFSNGRIYRLPVEALGQGEPHPGREVALAVADDLGHGVHVVFTDGTWSDLGWDFVLNLLEPAYEGASSRSIPRRVGGRIGQRIRMLRFARRWSAQRLADRTGMAQPNIIRLEKGHHEPTTGTLARIARGLGVSIPDLLEE